jgi:chromosomal replication initiation ATPase DnaA
MSVAVAGRALEQGLPRIQVYSRAFMARRRQERVRREQESVAAARMAEKEMLRKEQHAREERLAERMRLLDGMRADRALKVKASLAEREKRAAEDEFEALAQLEREIMANRRPAIEIMQEAATACGTDILAIRGHSRQKPIAAARRYAIVMVYIERSDLTLVQIGRLFNKDHTTILHSIRVAGVWRPSKPPRKP